MLSKVQTYFFGIIKGKKKGLISNLLKPVLLFFSWIYQVVVTCRNWGFDYGWLRQYSPPVPLVVSVGNIVAGGTGKTPLTLLLAQELQTDFSIAILARGYRSPVEHLSIPIVLSKGQGPMHPASYCGDEPYLLSSRLPKAFVFVGKDRQKASNMAARAGIQVVLLDDGMQHRRLARDIEIVVVDALDPFGQGHYLPRGLLREGLRSLSRADLVILNNVFDMDRFHKITHQILSYTSASVIGMRPEVEQIYNFEDQPLHLKAPQKIGIFCGIANPDYFYNTLQKLGFEIVDHYYVPDHESFNFDFLEKFADQCYLKGASYLICTEKDRVKLNSPEAGALPLAWVKTKMIIVEGEDIWKNFIQKTKTDVKSRI